MPAPPGRPQLIVSFSAAASSRDVLISAPVGASSRSLSPFAKGPWQSEQPEDFQISNPALARFSFCACAGDHNMTIARAVRGIMLARPQDQPYLGYDFDSKTISASNIGTRMAEIGPPDQEPCHRRPPTKKRAALG